MRKLRTSIFVAATLLAPNAWAQAEAPAAEVEAAAETPSEDAAEAPVAEAPPAPAEAEPEEPAAEEAPEPESSAKASASGGGTVSMGGGGGGGAAIVQMGDAADAGVRGPGGASGGSSTTNYGGPVSSDDDWKFEYHGYFRAPMRIGIDERQEAKTDQAKTTLGQPRVPDDQYLNWAYTKSNQRAWAETFFSYGKKTAKGVLSITGFNFTDAAYKDDVAQFGISQGWVELTPDVTSIDEDLRFIAKVGSFWARYGGAGRYDAGAYDNFIIGRTHVMGELTRVEYDLDESTVYFEQGFGAKEPNPDVFHNTKFTLLAHGHVGASFEELLDVNVHVMHAWTQEPDHDCISREEEWAVQASSGLQGEDLERLQSAYSGALVGSCKGEQVTIDTALDADTFRRLDSPDGSMTTAGIDAVFNAGLAGRIWAGYSRIFASHAVTVAPAYEVIHANGGGFFNMGLTHQYFIQPINWYDPTASGEHPQVVGGNGTIDTLAFQWDASLSSLIGPELFGGQQLKGQLFAMLNLIQSDDDVGLSNVSKLKFGADFEYSPLSWMGIGLRADRVAPRSDIPEQTFSILGPRLVFRSDFGTHEEITLGWAHYFYDTRECQPFEARDSQVSQLCVQPPTATVAPSGWYMRPGVTHDARFRGQPTEVSSDTGPFPDESWDRPMTDTFYISASIWW